MSESQIKVTFSSFEIDNVLGKASFHYESTNDEIIETDIVITTTVREYAKEDYSEEMLEHFTSGRRFLNDRPSIEVRSFDCFDEASLISVEDYCEIVRQAMTDYDKRKESVLLHLQK